MVEKITRTANDEQFDQPTEAGQEQANIETARAKAERIKLNRIPAFFSLAPGGMGGKKDKDKESDDSADQTGKKPQIKPNEINPEELQGASVESIESPEMKLKQATSYIDGFTKYFNAITKLGEVSAQANLSMYQLSGGETLDQLMEKAGGMVQKSGVRTGAYDEAVSRGAPQMAQPKLPERDKQILAQMTTAVVADVIKNAMAGMVGGNAPYMAAMSPTAVESSTKDLSGLLQSDMDKYEARKERIDAINFEMMIKHQDNLSAMKANIDARLDAADKLYNDMKFAQAKEMANVIIDSKVKKEQANVEAAKVGIEKDRVLTQTSQFNVAQANALEPAKARMAVDIIRYNMASEKAAKANNWSVDHLRLMSLMQRKAAEEMDNNMLYASDANKKISEFAVKYKNSRNVYDQINHASAPYTKNIVTEVYKIKDIYKRRMANENITAMLNAGLRPMNISEDFLNNISSNDYRAVIDKYSNGIATGDQPMSSFQDMIKKSNIVNIKDSPEFKSSSDEVKKLVESIDVINYTSHVGNTVLTNDAQQQETIEALRQKKLQK